jgi:hypothetical protein
MIPTVILALVLVLAELLSEGHRAGPKIRSARIVTNVQENRTTAWLVLLGRGVDYAASCSSRRVGQLARDSAAETGLRFC